MKKIKPLCSFCGKKEAVSKGLCSSCYIRMRRNKTPEYVRTKVNQSKLQAEETKKRVEQERQKKISNFVETNDERTERFKKWYAEDHLNYREIAEREEMMFGDKISRQRVHQILKEISGS